MAMPCSAELRSGVRRDVCIFGSGAAACGTAQRQHREFKGIPPPLTPWQPSSATNGYWPQGTPMISREERTPLSEWWWTVDRPLLGAIIALMLGGIILSLAASPPVATRIGLDPFHFFNRHVLFLLPSLIVLVAVSFLSPRQIRRAALIVFAVSIVLIVATLLLGPEVNGSRRWITLLGITTPASAPPTPPFLLPAPWPLPT